ncbi:uncharacterized protein [Oryza sativa Japonica Group]|uniref:uncharacterized protein isoform X2 n=1 Tax=Oryza sativa subsp. japonica TaxID=39947 RepID=UPI000E1B5CEE|nr:uncharacterized protein LOC4339052 isoform X3 [Oryza sativa Japonica Group]
MYLLSRRKRKVQTRICPWLNELLCLLTHPAIAAVKVLFPNESVQIILARMIGTIGPIDMEMLALGQDTQKYFTEDYDLFHKNEETDQLEYLIPEKISLRRRLQCPDTKFVKFLSYLLQINPRKRPTASEALQHPWLSYAYQ